VLLWTGNSYAQQKQWQQALNSYDRALSLRPDWQLAQGNRAKIAAIIRSCGKKSATACRRRARSRTINRMRSNTISNRGRR
jgi:tetratricopeptide (TPR) repeat protein